MSLPPCAGIGARAAHYSALQSGPAQPAWVEVHSENFFAEGGPALRQLDRLAERYPVSLHGVGMALGSVAPLDRDHLAALARLERRLAPAQISEHLCWGAVEGWHSNDLLPMPYTDEAVRHLAERIAIVQDQLGRRILIENVSCYVRFQQDTLTEWAFATAVCREAGCGLLLDLNNVYVNACNHGFAAEDFIAGIPVDLPGEFHLGGHEITPWGLVDTHGTPVCTAVWTLFEQAVARFGALPTLIERDNQLPPLSELLAEAARAEGVLQGTAAAAGAGSVSPVATATATATAAG